MQFFVIGIHTGIGKTVCSAILCEAMQADYWKPIQAGDLENTDSMKIARWVSNPRIKIWPEKICLNKAASPHVGLLEQNIHFKLSELTLPSSQNPLLIETAGGLLSPINQNQTNLDLIKHFKLPTVLVVQHYLGSINHSLLTLNTLHHNKIKIAAILFSGIANETSEEFIMQQFPQHSYLSIPHIVPSKETVSSTAQLIKSSIRTIIYDNAAKQRP